MIGPCSQFPDDNGGKGAAENRRYIGDGSHGRFFIGLSFHRDDHFTGDLFGGEDHPEATVYIEFSQFFAQYISQPAIIGFPEIGHPDLGRIRFSAGAHGTGQLQPLFNRVVDQVNLGREGVDGIHHIIEGLLQDPGMRSSLINSWITVS